MKKYIKLITAVLFLILGADIYAQGSGSTGLTDAWTTSTAKTYTILSRGLYAIGKNPANLALPGTAKVEFSTHFPLPNMSLRVGTDFANLDEYNYFIGGVDSNGTQASRLLDASDKQRFHDLFVDGGRILMSTSFNHLGFVMNLGEKIGTFGFAINDFVDFKFKIPVGIVDLLLLGNPQGSIIDINDLDAQASYTREYSFNYARDLGNFKPKFIQKLTAGVGIKLVHTYAYLGIQEVDTRIETTGPTIEGYGKVKTYMAFSPDLGMEYDFDSTGTGVGDSFGPFPTPAGSALGFDLGLSAIVNDRLSVGFAITDIGSMTFDQKPVEYSGNSDIYITDITSQEQRDSLTSKLRGEGKYIGSFEKDLPTALRLGVAYYVYKSGVDERYFLLGLDYNQGFNDEPRNSTKPRISLGGEWNATSWLPFLRGGFSFGGDDDFIWSVGAGFSIGPVEMNASIPDLQYIFTPGKVERIAFAFGGRWKF
ncbi:MAG: hypothetical protein AMXMBFR48_14970 [Ignavibacteriales bacterium]